MSGRYAPAGVRADVRLRCSAVALLAGCALLAAVPLQAGAAGRRVSCSQLRGRRLVSTRAVRVVEQIGQQEEGAAQGVAYACVPPNGPARAVGESSVEETSQISIHVSAVAWRWVALRFASFFGVGGSESGKAFNAATGRSYSFWDASNGPVVPPEKPVAHALNRALLDSAGQMALAVREGEAEQIVGIESGGTRRVLDSAPPAQIPPSSLQLKGSNVQWVDGGSTRTATL